MENCLQTRLWFVESSKAAMPLLPLAPAERCFMCPVLCRVLALGRLPRSRIVTRVRVLALTSQTPAEYLFLNQMRLSLMICSSEAAPAQLEGWRDAAQAGTRQRAAGAARRGHSPRQCESGPKGNQGVHRRLHNNNCNLSQPSL